jgi:hypothetical protein
MSVILAQHSIYRRLDLLHLGQEMLGGGAFALDNARPKRPLAYY